MSPLVLRTQKVTINNRFTGSGLETFEFKKYKLFISKTYSPPCLQKRQDFKISRSFETVLQSKETRYCDRTTNNCWKNTFLQKDKLVGRRGTKDRVYYSVYSGVEVSKSSTSKMSIRKLIKSFIYFMLLFSHPHRVHLLSWDRLDLTTQVIVMWDKNPLLGTMLTNRQNLFFSFVTKRDPRPQIPTSKWPTLPCPSVPPVVYFLFLIKGFSGTGWLWT